MAERWVEIQAAFAAAVDRPRDEWPQAVEALTDDPEVRREVLELLDSHASGGALDELADALRVDGEATVEETEIPESIGPYRILRVVGEGGMGIVFEAEQREPVQRRVAVKMMKVGMDTREVVGRFEAERQALALMDHPGIAKVLDGGATPQGRPYFVMELVRGIRLNDFCNRRRLTTRQRIELFVEICSAIQHAHQKGVIHRDLKPSNILVSEEEDRPLPRIIDFGIAKATGQQLTDKTVVTTLGQALGTLTYMSPEQADTVGLDVDTRTDIYALGVILYELLLGVVPLDPKEVGAPAFLARLVEPDSTPPTLSKKLASLSGTERETLARLRRTDPRAFRSELARDLQWIVMKAMHKDREGRYDSASALADDLRRFLRDEPVLAHPPAASYRVAKFVRRNRVPVAAAALVLVALTASTVLIARSRARALDSEAQALAEASRAEAVNGFLVGLLGSADPAEDGRNVRVADVLDRAAGSAAERFDESPVAEASVRMALGTTYRGLGLYDEGERELRAAAELYRDLGDPTLGDVLVELGSLLVARGDIEGARAVQAEALDVRREAFGSRSVMVGEALSALGESDFYAGDIQGAADRFREALAIYADSLEPDAEPVVYGTANLAAAVEELGLVEESLVLSEEALDGMRRLLGPDHVDVATVAGNHAIKLQAAGRVEEAEPFLVDALRIYRLAYGADSDRTARALNNLGAFFRRTGQLDASAEVLEEALAINLTVFGEDHREVATNLRNLGHVRFDQERYDEALDLYRRSLAINRAQRPDHPSVSQGMASVGWTLVQMGRTAEGEALLQEALDASVEAVGPDHFEAALIEVRLGDLAHHAGRSEEAETMLVEGHRRLLEALGPDHRFVQEAAESVAGYYRDVGREDQARRYRAQAEGRPPGS